MKPASPEPSDLVLRLRQQLILAQVRIMELEDVRETLVPRVAELEKQRQAGQAIADQKIEEAAHLERVLADLQVQHAKLEQAAQQAGRELTSVHAALAETNSRLAAQAEATARLTAALQQAEAGLRAVKSSRSWRWTAWLRALGGKP